MSTALPSDSTPAQELRMIWRGKQSEALLEATRYLDIEGAIRSSKTTIGLWKVLNSCIEYPGIRWLVSRWIDDDVNALLKPLLRLMFEQVGLAAQWFPDEHRFELPNGSWIYLRGLRPSENSSRFSKFRGMTLAGILVDQTEEMPEDFALELKGRLSQKGYPPQLIFTPNPPATDHWLSRMFPDTESGAPTADNHKYIRLSIYDNKHNLEPGYIEQLEQDYPVGHPMRRRLLDGKRGLNVQGKPVYDKYFERARHAQAVAMNPNVPVIEAIDCGYHHPCVLWMQFQPWGELTLLGGVQGERLYVEDFAPIILQFRAEWFTGALEFHTCCDPAGSHENSQGTKKNAVAVLKENGIYPMNVANSNMPEVREYAIQQIAGYMRRRTSRGEAFRVGLKNWQVVSAVEARYSTYALDALEAGYVWDERVRRSAGGKSIMVPLKGTPEVSEYEHVMNCAEYGILNYGPARPTARDERKAEAAMIAAITAKDYDPADRPSRHNGGMGGRGGYG